MNNTTPLNLQGPGFLKPWKAQPQVKSSPGDPSPQQEIKESVVLNAAPAADIVKDTRSGIHAEFRKSDLGTAMSASLPAGGLLPAAVLLQSVQGPSGSTVEAFVDKGGEKVPLQAGKAEDGRIYVQLDNSPHSPMLMFDPANLDYGLFAQSKSRDDGSRHRTLAETIHADGSRSLVQDHTVARDGSQSYHLVQVDAEGKARGGAARVDAQGKQSWTEMAATIDDEEQRVSLRGPSGAPVRSLLDHTLDSIKNPFSLKSPLLSWMKEKKQAATVAGATFRTFGQAAIHTPAYLFPNLMATLGQAPQTQTVAAAKDTAPAASAGNVQVLSGDITRIPADGIVTLVNSQGAWFGGVDGAIMKVAGGMYHQQLKPDQLDDGNVVIAKKRGITEGQFKDVIFVVDDHEKPLQALVMKALKAADEAGLRSVNLPAFRTGAAAGLSEGQDGAIAATAEAIRKFQAESPANLKDINVVVFGRPEVAEKFKEALGR